MAETKQLTKFDFLTMAIKANIFFVVASLIFVTITFVGIHYLQPSNKMIGQEIQTKIEFLLADEEEEVGIEQRQLRKDLLVRLQTVVDTFLDKNRGDIQELRAIQRKERFFRIFVPGFLMEYVKSFRGNPVL